jgi:hypothetical protein
MSIDYLAESTRIFKDVAARFILDGWYWNNFAGKSFMDFLTQEADEQWQIPHYFVAGFDRESSRKDMFEDLSLVLRQATEDDILLKGYLELTEDLLKETLQGEISATVKDMFRIYRDVKAIMHSELSREERQIQITALVKDHPHLDNWQWM